MHERGRRRFDPIDRTPVGVEQDRAATREVRAGFGGAHKRLARCCGQWFGHVVGLGLEALALEGPAGSGALRVAGGHRDVRAARPHELGLEVAEIAGRHVSPADAGQRSEQPAQIAGGPEVLTADVHRRAAAAAVEMEDRRELRLRVGRPTKPGGERLGGLRPWPRDDESGDRPRHRVNAEREARHHAEVPATAAAERPVKIRIAARARGAQPSIGGHDLRAQEVVRGQAELPAGETHPAADGVTGDADRRTRSGGDRQPVGGERRVHVDQLRPRADRRRALGDVDGDAAHVAQVEHHAARQGRIPGVAMAAGPRPQGHRVRDPPIHRGHDVRCVERARHEVR